MGHSYFSEANIHQLVQHIPFLLLSPKVYYHAHKSLPLSLLSVILIQPTPPYPISYFNIILHPTPVSPM